VLAPQVEPLQEVLMKDPLALGDYRWRVAELYLAEPVEGAEGVEAFRRGRDVLFRDHPQSALPAAARATFTGLRWFPYDPAARVVTRLEPAEHLAEVTIDTGGEDGAVRYRRIGRLATPWGGLTLFWMLGYGGGLFLPFRDATSGHQTYGAGRYLTDTVKGTFGRGLESKDAGEVVLDLNYAYNPSCAYDPRWACPLAPPENWLPEPVEAGELAFEQADQDD
jgi:uncharacterized protein